MSLIRVRDRTRPGDTSRDINLGPAEGRYHNWKRMARTVDDQRWTSRDVEPRR